MERTIKTPKPAQTQVEEGVSGLPPSSFEINHTHFAIHGSCC
jgi:hypothetical protein